MAKDDKYIGHCPYHRVCLEGLADEHSSKIPVAIQSVHGSFFMEGR